MWNKNETRRAHPPGRLSLVLGCLILAASGWAQSGLIGDVNLDGAINVLDVQASINMALGVSDASLEADTDLNDAVDVRDVQTLVNTALGVGGLLQRVSGAVPAAKLAAGMEVVALSLDGRIERAAVNPATGEFELLLGVRTAWSVALFGAMAGTPHTWATLSFPVAGDGVTALPLPDVSNGAILDLGAVLGEIGDVCSVDVRTLLARLGPPLPWADSDADGLPDMVESLIGPYIENPALLGIAVPSDLNMSALNDYVSDYFENAALVDVFPGLTGAEIDGIPDFLDPVLEYLYSGVAQWLNSGTFVVPQQLIDIYNGHITKWLAAQMGSWLAALNLPSLQDSNGNWIPDHIEGLLCLEGGCELDADGDGIPDFAQDDDGDGVPNLLDRDMINELDADGDGVPDEFDLDDDNDGVPDYADAAPTDPSRS